MNTADKLVASVNTCFVPVCPHGKTHHKCLDCLSEEVWQQGCEIWKYKKLVRQLRGTLKDREEKLKQKTI
jgi:hypothetical protein